MWRRIQTVVAHFPGEVKDKITADIHHIQSSRTEQEFTQGKTFSVPLTPYPFPIPILIFSY